MPSPWTIIGWLLVLALVAAVLYAASRALGTGIAKAVVPGGEGDVPRPESPPAPEPTPPGAVA